MKRNKPITNKSITNDYLESQKKDFMLFVFGILGLIAIALFVAAYTYGMSKQYCSAEHLEI